MNAFYSVAKSNEWEGDHKVLADNDEMQHLYAVLDSFSQYRRAAHYHATHVRRQNFYALPSRQWTTLKQPPFSFLDVLDQVDDCIDTNANLAEAIFHTAMISMDISMDTNLSDLREGFPPWHNSATRLDLDKARSTIHQLVRDWSAEGAEEREACYGPVMSKLCEEFQNQLETGQQIEVLVPGAGLGRFVFDLNREGFHAEGNEISYHQILASSFVLNHTTKANEWPLHPFALSFSNVRSRKDQLREVRIPDVYPGMTLSAGRMSMTTGDFVQVYGGEENTNRFDAVSTVFFVDTAPNIQTYIDTIWRCLKPGAIWVNLGPLLWHFDGQQKDNDTSRGKGDNTVAGSFEPSLEEVLLLVQHAGFVVEKYEMCSSTTGYMQNGRSMLKSVYEPCLWVIRKPI